MGKKGDEVLMFPNHRKKNTDQAVDPKDPPGDMSATDVYEKAWFCYNLVNLASWSADQIALQGEFPPEGTGLLMGISAVLDIAKESMVEISEFLLQMIKP